MGSVNPGLDERVQEVSGVCLNNFGQTRFFFPQKQAGGRPRSLQLNLSEKSSQLPTNDHYTTASINHCNTSRPPDGVLNPPLLLIS